MCNFHVGQKVVFIGDDPGFDSEPGKTIHIVKGIRQSCCCVEIDVGISLSAKGARGGSNQNLSAP